MPKLRFHCIVLDHDDTAVDSTRTIHFPAHQEVMRRLRPDHPEPTLDNWFSKNFHPGIMALLTEELGFNEDELKAEFEIWQSFTKNSLPEFFPGFQDTIREYREAGGTVAVVSHSEVPVIEKHYEAAGFMPDLIYGWDHDHEKRKPHPYPLYDIIEKTGHRADGLLVVDDLRPGIEMAHTAGVAAAGAGWAHQIPEIRSFMEDACDYYLETIQDFKELILRKE